MKVLVDTNILIWALINPQRLSEKAIDVLLNPDTEIVVSSASLWEIGIKYHAGKMPEIARIFMRIEYYLTALDAQELPITHKHALLAASLPLIHKDPFDRVLVAQSLAEGLPLVTKDAILGKYNISVIW